MPSIGRSDVGFAEGADVGPFKHLLQLLDVIDDPLNIHPEQYSGTLVSKIIGPEVYSRISVTVVTSTPDDRHRFTFSQTEH